MLNRFEGFIQQHGLCSKEDGILLAVSGGKDSMVMLHLFRAAGYRLGVAHCNFQLRGAESDADEQFLHTICNTLHIPFHSKRFNTNNYAVEKGLSIQMAARGLRYTWFNELLQGEEWDRLATAHHLNDNLETTLMNVVRGTGLDGLGGIPEKAGVIIRPMIDFSQEEIMTYATANAIEWREDSSNATTNYDRNFIRKEVIPKLKVLNPSLENTFARNLQRIQGAKELFQLGLTQLKKELMKEHADQIYIDKIKLGLLQNPIPILWEIVKGVGFNYEQCEQVVRACRGTSGKKFSTISHQLTIDRDFIILSHHQGWESTQIDVEGNELSLGPWKLKIERKEVFEIPTSQWEAVLDAEKVTFPLIWRKWREGDVFYPLGMSHRKKLSDFFIDNKVALPDKNKATVIESGGNIVWVVGYRVDDRFKVSDTQKPALRFLLTSHFE